MLYLFVILTINFNSSTAQKTLKFNQSFFYNAQLIQLTKNQVDQVWVPDL